MVGLKKKLFSFQLGRTTVGVLQARIPPQHGFSPIVCGESALNHCSVRLRKWKDKNANQGNKLCNWGFIFITKIYSHALNRNTFQTNTSNLYHLSFMRVFDAPQTLRDIGWNAYELTLFKWQSAGLEIRRSEVRIPVQVQVFLLRSYNVKFPKANKLWVWFQLMAWFEYHIHVKRWS